MKKWWVDSTECDCFCEMSKTSWQMGKHLTNGDLENHVKARLSRLVHWLSILLLLRRTSRGSTNLVRQCYLDFFSDVYCSRENVEMRYYGCRH